VADTGVGIEPETKARIFEPYYTTDPVQGTGLGLSTVRRIVQQSGGEIEVHSVMGAGTTFDVLLPTIGS
jgi:signal transduction histidine kinase